MRLFLVKAVAFVAPYALGVGLVYGLLWRVGEIAPTSAIVERQAKGEPFLYLAAFSDHTYALKRDAVVRLKPEVIALGGSRVNQWRSAMFQPYRFYNAGNAVYWIAHYRRFLEELPDDAVPRVVLFSLDFYMWSPEWESFFEAVSFEPMRFWWSDDRVPLLKQAAAALGKDPAFALVPLREPVYALPAEGLSAIRAGVGTRIDGSYQYGSILKGVPPPGWVTPEAAIARVAAGTVPFGFRDRMEPQRWDELARFAETCRRRGIGMIALSQPYDPGLVAAAFASPRHGIWREFYSEATRERIRSLGIAYFDFTNVAAFDGVEGEMIDPFHASETAHVRMFVKMLERDDARRLLPDISMRALRTALVQASPLETYRNTF